METEELKNNQLTSRLWLIPLVLILAVVPLITIIHVYDCGLEDNPWFSTGGKLYDFFLYYKAFVLRLVGIILLFILSYTLSFYDRKFLNKTSIIPLVFWGIFFIGTIASAALSNHKNSAFFGGYEQFEGWFVILTYMLVFFYSYAYVRKQEFIQFVLDALLVGSTIIGILGALQAVGLDWIQSTPARYILTPELIGQMDLSKFNIKLNFGAGTSYVTLYNPNYVGSYVSLVLPYCIYMTVRGKKLWRQITAGISCILLIITLIASGSLTGVLGLIAGGIVFSILMIKEIKKLKILLICGAIILISAGVGIVVMQPALLSKLIPGTGTEVYYIDTMTADGLSIDIETGSGKSIRVSLDKNNTLDFDWADVSKISDIVTITDKTGNTIETSVDDVANRISITESGYEPLQITTEYRGLDSTKLSAYLSDYNRLSGTSSEITVSSEDEINESQTSINLINIIDGSFSWSFTVVNSNIYIYNDFGRLDTLEAIERLGFDGRYYFGSRRGYIWSRTLPLLGDHLLLGVGADNFVYAFPNNDYVGKKYMGYNTQTITKPHDMYLQIWVQDGLPALIGFIGLYIVFLVRVFVVFFRKKYRTTDDNKYYKNIVAVTAAAVTAYMIVGFANDSTITVAPLYWVLLGTGYATESLIRKIPHE